MEALGVFVLVTVGLITSGTKVQVVALSAAATALVTVMSHASGLFMNASIATGKTVVWAYIYQYWF